MPRFALVLEYDGTCFQGWQRQPNGPTVQAALEEALTGLAGEPVRVMGASRTDSGVHARGQVAHCDLPSWRSAPKLRAALNTRLEGVVVLESWAVAPEFDARRWAVRKQYCYRVLNRVTPSPLRARRCWHVRHPLDVDAMRRAAELLVGDHDFVAFRGAPGGAPATERTQRTLERLDVERSRDEIHLWAASRGFLRYMVRNLAGTLVEVGRGKREAEDMPGILASLDRSRAGATAPAWGLTLESIEYPPGTLREQGIPTGPA